MLSKITRFFHAYNKANPVMSYDDWLAKRPKPRMLPKPRIRVKAWNEEHVLMGGFWVKESTIKAIADNVMNGIKKNEYRIQRYLPEEVV